LTSQSYEDADKVRRACYSMCGNVECITTRSTTTVKKPLFFIVLGITVEKGLGFDEFERTGDIESIFKFISQ